jgi:hypothetical protein
MLYMFQAVSLPVIRSSNCTHSIWYISSLLAATASMGEFQLAVAARKLDTYQMLCVQFEHLMTGAETA